MAEQTYDLTQQGAEVQAIINDANNCKGAGAQTTLTTESILLKDVNGQYHKILKSSFTEAIRDTLAGLLVNNDKGTTINQIAAIASGDFGSVTPANLASVLGDEPPLLNPTKMMGFQESPGKYLVLKIYDYARGLFAICSGERTGDPNYNMNIAMVFLREHGGGLGISTCWKKGSGNITLYYKKQDHYIWIYVDTSSITYPYTSIARLSPISWSGQITIPMVKDDTINLSLLTSVTL